eukprot:7100513-Heterocapsa_arctica.AAC.1
MNHGTVRVSVPWSVDHPPSTNLSPSALASALKASGTADHGEPCTCCRCGPRATHRGAPGTADHGEPQRR